MEWLDQFWYLIWLDVSEIVRAIRAEIRSGFTMFVVVTDNAEIDLVDRSIMANAGNTPQEVSEYFRANPGLITNMEQLHSVNYAIFTLPLSLTLASAVFTTAWTFLVVSSILIARSVCHMSVTVRKALRACCVNPWHLWGKVIVPVFVIWTAGVFIMWLVG